MVYSLDEINSFMVVAEELSFRRAAERLNISQPPLSRKIKKLEHAIQVQLLERDNRHVVLTPAGEAFLPEARKLLALAESAPDLARRIARGAAGIVRIGYTAASTYVLLGNLLNDLSAKLPELEIGLLEMLSREQLASLMQRDIDLGLARPPFDAAIFDSRLVYSEPMVVAVPAGHRLARQNQPIPAEDLRDEDLVMHSPTRSRYFYDLAIRILPEPNARFVHTVTQVRSMISLVGAGRGIALVPRSSSVLSIKGVTYLELIGDEQNQAQIYAVWLREIRNPALGRALEVVEECVV